MKKYPATKIRNVAILGHSGSGKTSFAEALLYNSKSIDRIGKVNDGNTTLDFDPEEIRRGVTINTSVATFEWNDLKINLLDTPGDFDFMGEVVEALRVADSSFITVSGKSGLTVGAEKSMRYCRGRDIPYVFVINKMDEKNANFAKVLQDLKDYAGKEVVAFMLPIMENGKMTGFVDTVHKQAYKLCGKGEAEKIDMPADMVEHVNEVEIKIIERVAETSEELMEKYFADEPFTAEEYLVGMKASVRAGKMRPVYCISATENWATRYVMNSALVYLPSPAKAPARKGTCPDGTEIEVRPVEEAPFFAQVFKTIVDPFVGRISLFRVYSGSIKNGDSLYNANREKDERINGLSYILGKKTSNVDEVSCGDIGALTKLNYTLTGDTLCNKSDAAILRPIEFPVPSFAMAILPVTRGEEDKIMSGLNKLKDEDPTFEIVNNAETKQMVISGLGAQHIDVLRSKLKAKYKVESTLEEPRVPYRETIRKTVKVQGKHKKQSGGHGQYGDVWIEFAPGDCEGLEFEQKIFGGSVPKAYHPAVEKGLLDSIDKGPLAGYPVVNLKATLLDGSYHDVDSSEMAFKLAAGLAYRAAMPKASPVILEPISEVKVYVPEAQLGDIMSDMNQRRGRIMGIEPKKEVQMLLAEVPTSEMASYATDLRSMTQGRGWYSVKFVRYDQAPQDIMNKVIADAKAREEE